MWDSITHTSAPTPFRPLGYSGEALARTTDPHFHTIGLRFLAFLCGFFFLLLFFIIAALIDNSWHWNSERQGPRRFFIWRSWGYYWQGEAGRQWWMTGWEKWKVYQAPEWERERIYLLSLARRKGKLRDEWGGKEDNTLVFRRRRMHISIGVTFYN